MSASSSRQLSIEPRNHNGRPHKGAAVIEASLTLMLFLVIWFSLFDFGYVLYFHHTIVERARAAARYGILLDASDQQSQARIKNYFLYNDPVKADGAAGILGLTPGNVDVAVLPPTVNEPAPRLVVSVRNYQYLLVTPGVAGLYGGRDIIASLPVENY
jgi:Flp pilus assembly protein TadG